MPLWLFQFLLLAGVLFALLYALSRVKPARLSAQNDKVFYASLLKEIETGHFENTQERAQAKLEIARKLLQTKEVLSETLSSKTKRLAALTVLILLPLGSFGLYHALGSPALPAQPLASRSLPANSPLNALVAKVETHLAKNPDDAKGWEVLAPVYLQLEEYPKAVEARRNLLRLQGNSAIRLGDLGEAMLMQNNGVMSSAIEAVFSEAARFDATDLRAAYYQGLALKQDGKREAAREIWEKLLQSTSKQDEKTFLKQEIDRLDAQK